MTARCVFHYLDITCFKQNFSFFINWGQAPPSNDLFTNDGIPVSSYWALGGRNKLEPKAMVCTLFYFHVEWKIKLPAMSQIGKLWESARFGSKENAGWNDFKWAVASDWKVARE